MAISIQEQERLELEKLAAEVLEDEAPIAIKKPAAGITLDTFINGEKLHDDLSVNPADLSTAYVQHASLFAWYCEQYRQAQFQADKMDNQEKLVYAKIETGVRNQATIDAEKITEATVKSRVLLDPRYQKIVQLKLEAEMIAGMTKDATEAFKQRRDMLIQLGSDAREEFKGSMRMRDTSTLEERQANAMRIIGEARSR